MEVRNCRKCGKIFNYTGGPCLCQLCKKDLEDKFQQVKEYIRENPGSSVVQISEDNDVSVQQIKQWIRQERLVFTENSQVVIECEKCGAPIRTGRFCENCKRKMADTFQGMYGSTPAQQESVSRDGKIRYTSSRDWE